MGVEITRRMLLLGTVSGLLAGCVVAEPPVVAAPPPPPAVPVEAPPPPPRPGLRLGRGPLGVASARVRVGARLLDGADVVGLRVGTGPLGASRRRIRVDRRPLACKVEGGEHSAAARSSRARLALGAAQSPRRSSAAPGPAALPGPPFTLGVASGYPAPTGVVLWTRLAPAPLHAGRRHAARGRAGRVGGRDRRAHAPRRAARHRDARRPTWAHAVHVEVDGLEPGRWYWYRFRAGGEVSRDRPHAHGARPPAPPPTACGSRSPRASSTSRATTPPTATCWPTIST